MLYQLISKVGLDKPINYGMKINSFFEGSIHDVRISMATDVSIPHKPCFDRGT